MSGNDHLHLAPSKKKTDARVRRTRDALGDALIALMQEKAVRHDHGAGRFGPRARQSFDFLLALQRQGRSC